MRTLRWLALSALAVASVATAQAPKIEKLSEHAYAYLTGPGRANAGFIVTDEGVLVVDSLDTVIHAEEFIAEIRKISTKPILYVVNTNFHYDHVTGNQLFLKEARALVAHEQTRKNMMQLGQDELTSMKQNYALEIEQFEKSLRDDPLTDAERADVDARLADAKKSLVALDRTQLTPATLTLTQGTLRCYLGGVEIDIIFLGRGHTDGDVVVHLPAESVVYTGGLLFAQTVPWLRGSYIQDWQATIDQLLKLQFDKVVPGTGEMATRDDIIAFKGYLTDLYTAVKNQFDQGVSADDVRWKVDMSAYQAWTNYDNYLRYNIEDAYAEIQAARKGGD